MGWLLWAALLGGCSAPPADQVVARIGERAITVGEYDQLAARLLAGPLRGLEPIDGEARERLLKAMIDKELLLLEARARRLDQDSEVAAEVERLEEKLLHRALYERQLGPAEVGEEEVEDYFHEGGFDQEIRLSHILCASPEEALGHLAALREGAAFATLAAAHSRHRPSARRGGDMGFMPLAHMLPEVREAVLSLEPGQVHPAPVPSRYGFHVFKVVERRAADLAQYRAQVRTALEAQRRAAQWAAYADSLGRAYGLTCGPGGESELCRWRGGSLSRAEYMQALGGGAGDSAALEELARRQLLAAEAREQGCHLDPGLRAQVRRRQEELLAERLRAQVVAAVGVEEEELRAFYAAHPELYGVRPEVEVQEILVASQELAARLRRRLEAGEDMGELAAQHHTRAATGDLRGRMWLSTRDNPLLGPLAPAALDGEVGALYGPLEVPGGFSLFRVLQRRQRPGQSFEQVRHRIALVLGARAQDEKLERFLGDLREKYAAQVQVHPQVLALALREPPQPRAQEGLAGLAWSDQEQGE
jgi:parvulin-like peptidyl-prolyl isomerase